MIPFRGAHCWIVYPLAAWKLTKYNSKTVCIPLLKKCNMGNLTNFVPNFTVNVKDAFPSLWMVRNGPKLFQTSPFNYKLSKKDIMGNGTIFAHYLCWYFSFTNLWPSFGPYLDFFGSYLDLSLEPDKNFLHRINQTNTW